MNRFLKLFLVVLFAGCGWENIRAQVYVGYFNAGVVSKYDVSTGVAIDEQFILGLKQPRALCLVGGSLYVLSQGDGTVGKYDARTGATINAQFITGLNMPQAMTIADGALYVASFGWAGPEGGSAPNLISKYNAETGAVINYTLATTEQLATNLAASNQKLYVAGGSQMHPQSVYDANTGTPIGKLDFFGRLVSGAEGMAVMDHWLYLTAGAWSSAGAVFKFDLEAESPTEFDPNIFRPFIAHLNQSGEIAVSGDELFIGGPGTSVSKYNVFTGELIKTAFIPNLSDRFGGLAVVPRASTQQNSWAMTTFEAKNDFLRYAYWTSMHGDYLYYISEILVGLVVLGFLALLFFRSVPKWLEPTPVEATPSITETAAASPEASPEETEPTEASANSAEVVTDESESTLEPLPISHSWSLTTVAVVIVFTVTLGLAGFLAWLGSQAMPSPNYMPHRDTHDLIGIWSYENDTRELSQMPVLLTLEVSATHLDFSSGSGMKRLDGKWHDDGFWIQKPDGTDEVEVAKIVRPEEIEFHQSAFDPSDPTVDTLYKDRGTDAEMKAIADKYPGPITYPPPAGVIKYFMTEYQLTSLPWKPDHLEIEGESYSRAKIYVYRSDDPHLEPLKVTVKNHQVVEFKGGNG